MEEKKYLPEEGASPDPDDIPAKSMLQIQKESWYDKVPLTVRQLDIIIWVCLTLLGLIFVGIGLDAAGIWDVF